MTEKILGSDPRYEQINELQLTLMTLSNPMLLKQAFPELTDEMIETQKLKVAEQLTQLLGGQ